MAAQEIVQLDADTVLMEVAPVAEEDVYRLPPRAPEFILEVFAGQSADEVTVVSQAVPTEGLARADKVVTVPQRGKARILISRSYADQVGRVIVRHSATSGVTASAFYLRGA